MFQQSRVVLLSVPVRSVPFSLIPFRSVLFQIIIYKHRGHIWIGKAAKIRCFLSRVSRQQSTCNGFMFVIKNHANKKRLIKKLVIYVPTKLSSLAFTSSPFRSVQSRSVPFQIMIQKHRRHHWIDKEAKILSFLSYVSRQTSTYNDVTIVFYNVTFSH